MLGNSGQSRIWPRYILKLKSPGIRSSISKRFRTDPIRNGGLGMSFLLSSGRRPDRHRPFGLERDLLDDVPLELQFRFAFLAAHDRALAARVP
jgi:hypothetical protein